MPYEWNKYTDLDEALDNILTVRNSLNDIVEALYLVSNNEKLTSILSEEAKVIDRNYKRAYTYLKAEYKNESP